MTKIVSWREHVLLRALREIADSVAETVGEWRGEHVAPDPGPAGDLLDVLDHVAEVCATALRDPKRPPAASKYAPGSQEFKEWPGVQLTVRAANGLLRNGIDTLEKLLMLDPQIASRWRGFGAETVAIIVAAQDAIRAEKAETFAMRLLRQETKPENSTAPAMAFEMLKRWLAGDKVAELAASYQMTEEDAVFAIMVAFREAQ